MKNLIYDDLFESGESTGFMLRILPIAYPPAPPVVINITALIISSATWSLSIANAVISNTIKNNTMIVVKMCPLRLDLSWKALCCLRSSVCASNAVLANSKPWSSFCFCRSISLDFNSISFVWLSRNSLKRAGAISVVFYSARLANSRYFPCLYPTLYKGILNSIRILPK